MFLNYSFAIGNLTYFFVPTRAILLVHFKIEFDIGHLINYRNIIIFYFRFIVRDFQYSEEEIQAGKTELDKLHADQKKQFVSGIYLRLRLHLLLIL